MGMQQYKALNEKWPYPLNAISVPIGSNNLLGTIPIAKNDLTQLTPSLLSVRIVKRTRHP